MRCRLVLVYVGSKIFLQQFIGKIDPAISLGITISILLGGIALSLWKTRNDPPEAKPALAEYNGRTDRQLPVAAVDENCELD